MFLRNYQPFHPFVMLNLSFSGKKMQLLPQNKTNYHTTSVISFIGTKRHEMH